MEGAGNLPIRAPAGQRDLNRGAQAINNAGARGAAGNFVLRAMEMLTEERSHGATPDTEAGFTGLRSLLKARQGKLAGFGRPSRC